MNWIVSNEDTSYQTWPRLISKGISQSWDEKYFTREGKDYDTRRISIWDWQEKGLDSFFTEDGMSYLIKQIKERKEKDWNKKFKHSVFYKKPKDAPATIYYAYAPEVYDYSLPLFSKDRKYVLIYVSAPGWGSMNLYQKIGNKTWKKLTSFMGWQA